MNLGPRASAACRVPLLSGLMIVGAVLVKADPAPLSVEAFTGEVLGHALAVETAPFPTIAALHPGGRAEIQSALGTWHGHWAGQGDDLCLFFETGPLTGQRCVTVTRTTQGYETSHGTELTLVARAKRF